MGLDDDALRDDDEALIRQLLDSEHPWLDGITYEQLQDEAWARLNLPRGHRPYVDTTPDTPDGRLILGSLRYRPGTETPDGDPDRARRYPLALQSRKQHQKFLNASYGGDAHLPRPPEPRLQIHADDAAAHGITEGERVTVTNDRGALTVTATISDEVQPGLVALPFGWWHRHSADDRGVNALTNPMTTPDDLGSAAFHETLVEVAPASNRDGDDA